MAGETCWMKAPPWAMFLWDAAWAKPHVAPPPPLASPGKLKFRIVALLMFWLLLFNGDDL